MAEMISDTDARRRRKTARRRSAVAAVVVVAGFGAVFGCSAAKAALVDRALGTWACAEPDGDFSFSIEIERGRYSAVFDTDPGEAPPPGAALTGTWDLDGTELTLEMDQTDRTITVDGVSEDTEELSALLDGERELTEVHRVSDDEVTFTSKDPGATTWTCRRA